MGFPQLFLLIEYSYSNVIYQHYELAPLPRNDACQPQLNALKSLYPGEVP